MSKSKRRRAIGVDGQYQGMTSSQRSEVDAWITGLSRDDINSFPRRIGDLASDDESEYEDAAYGSDHFDGWRDRAFLAGFNRASRG